LEGLLRMKDALDRIESGLEDQLDIEAIAGAAYMSPFHFQRMFHMLTGMTVAEYARKRKLTLAAQELAITPSKVLDVALKYGYDSPESFAKAFRKIHGVSPSEARHPDVRLKAFPRLSFHLSLKGDKDMDYRIVEKEAFNVIGKSIRTNAGAGKEEGDIPRFWGRCNTDGTSERLAGLEEDGNFLGICLEMEPGEGEFTYMVGRETTAEPPDESFELRRIPASVWAIFTAVGPVATAIPETFERIFQEWFPATGYEHAGSPEMEVYLPGDVNEADYRSEIWIPVVKKA